MKKEQILKRLQEAEELKDCVITEGRSKRLDTKDTWCISIFPNGSSTGIIMHRGCFSEDNPVQDVLNALKGKELREKLLHKAEDMDLGEFLSNLYVEAYNFNTVRDKLDNFVYIQKDDIVLVLCLLLYQDSEGIMSAKVSHGLLGLKDLAVAASELIQLAALNTAILFGMTFEKIDQFMIKRNLLSSDLETVINPNPNAVQLYILTVKTHLHGASLIFTKEMQQAVFNAVGPYYVLPSSIHEVMILTNEPFNKYNSNRVKELVKEGNSFVQENEVLSENVYYFDGNKLILC